MWISCPVRDKQGSFRGMGRGYLVAVTGSSWQLWGPRGCYGVYTWRLLEGCHVYIPKQPCISCSPQKIEWIIHSIYGVKKFHSLRSEFHSILTPVEWKFTTQRVESRPVHSIFTPKEVITDVNTEGVMSVTNRVKIHYNFFRECNYQVNPVTAKR